MDSLPFFIIPNRDIAEEFKAKDIKAFFIDSDMSGLSSIIGNLLTSIPASYE